MKKVQKMMLSFAAIVIMFCMVGCGKVSYEDITGNWTMKSVNGKSIEEYAKTIGMETAMATSNFKITDDDKMVATSIAGSATYNYERKSNGIEVREQGKEEILMSMAYDAEAKTLTYKIDLGDGNAMDVVLVRGTADFNKQEGGDINDKVK